MSCLVEDARPRAHSTTATLKMLNASKPRLGFAEGINEPSHAVVPDEVVVLRVDPQAPPCLAFAEGLGPTPTRDGAQSPHTPEGLQIPMIKASELASGKELATEAGDTNVDGPAGEDRNLVQKTCTTPPVVAIDPVVEDASDGMAGDVRSWLESLKVSLEGHLQTAALGMERKLEVSFQTMLQSVEDDRATQWAALSKLQQSLQHDLKHFRNVDDSVSPASRAENGHSQNEMLPERCKVAAIHDTLRDLERLCKGTPDRLEKTENRLCEIERQLSKLVAMQIEHHKRAGSSDGSVVQEKVLADCDLADRKEDMRPLSAWDGRALESMNGSLSGSLSGSVRRRGEACHRPEAPYQTFERPSAVADRMLGSGGSHDTHDVRQSPRSAPSRSRNGAMLVIDEGHKIVSDTLAQARRDVSSVRWAPSSSRLQDMPIRFRPTSRSLSVSPWSATSPSALSLHSASVRASPGSSVSAPQSPNIVDSTVVVLRDSSTRSLNVGGAGRGAQQSGAAKHLKREPTR